MPKIVDHDLYRKELLHKSFDLLAEKGYAAITMRQIAQGLGVSTGTLYHYFPSKESLFEQLMEEQAQQDILLATAELERLPSLKEKLAALFEFLQADQDNFFKRSLLFVDFYQEQQREGKVLSDVLQRVCQRIQETIAALLDINDPELIIFILSYIDGLMWSPIYDHKPINFARQTEILTQMLTAYLKPANPQK
ncbi:MAG: TetR/AcrR family transcriptional regulator [Oscillatoriophycideae cyanobacterium NC_groundwater_1537_Pr4_S-0.65um_50_18]|nr:TetR/AcrR family transcriptional regulator [Oscillatoriophycideae cyanobacterium NC_groundwater_1537_Pr4_S-0.65um_50_18]